MKHFLTTALFTLAVTASLSGTAFSQVGRPSAGSSAPEAPPVARPLERIVADLEASTQQNPQLYFELHALLLASPELVAEIPGRLKLGEANLDASAVLIYALEDIDTTETQAALVSIHADRGQRHMDRLRAAVSLGSVKVPTEASLASLWAAAERWSDPESVDVANTSLLALGRAGRSLREAWDPRHERVRDDLLRRLRSTPRRSERAMTLKALGNLRDLTLGGEISNYLVDESAPVRATSAQALGMLGDATHRELLVELLPEEVHGAVRCARVEALRQIPADPQSLGAVHVLAQCEPHTESRAQMVRYLVEHVREFDQSIETLRWMTFNDPSNQVRLLASSVLGL